MTTAQPEIRKGKSFNAIWVIPILAVVLGVWMVAHTWMTEGPEIMISFDTAEGLTAGKTKVKYRNVEMGVVQEVILSDDFQGVLAKVKMERQALPLLRDDTRFWVVTAQIGVGNISGLDTLLSGAYIRMGPGEGKIGTRRYDALERPPQTAAGAPGLRLRLEGDRAGSVSTGDSVVYRGYKVGRIENMEFDADRRRAMYTVFIDAPYDELVDSSVRFYNISGISLNASAEGLQVSTGSMDTVLLGGVTFATPPGMPAGEPVENNTEFKLYGSLEEAETNPFSFGSYYVVRFSQSIKGLLPGAPVEYRGIPIGRVERLMYKDMILQNRAAFEAGEEDLGGDAEPIPVLLYIEPARLGLPDNAESVAMLSQTVSAGVPAGMRATIETGNLLTGAKYIGIDRFEVDETVEMGEWGGYPEIPTIGGGFDQVLVKVNELLDKFNRLPLDQTVGNANEALAELDKTLAGLRKIVNNKDTQALPGELRATLDGLSPDSPLYQNLNSTLQQLNRTLGNVESLTRTLSGQPNAAIMPSKLPPDPIPEAKR
ncbi:MAG: intermembrane transport protein PqiB [Halieaceae bacterium]